MLEVVISLLTTYGQALTVLGSALSSAFYVGYKLVSNHLAHIRKDLIDSIDRIELAVKANHGEVKERITRLEDILLRAGGPPKHE